MATPNKPLGFREISSTTSSVGKKSAQMSAMKGLLSKGKKPSSGPGKVMPEVIKASSAKSSKGDGMKKMGKSQPKAKDYPLAGGFYGTKNYDPSVWR